MSQINQSLSDFGELEYDRLVSELKKDPFVKIGHKYQLLINLMLEFRDEYGICKITQKRLSELLDCSQSRISQMITSLNTEDICVEKIKSGEYRIIYNNIFKRGTFNKLFLLYFDFISEKLDYRLSCKSIAEKYKIKTKTVQMFKSYMRLIYNECKDNLE